MIGRTALVTGAAQGIGAGVARVLHDRGANVVLSDVDAAKAAETARAIGDRTLAVETDVRDKGAVAAACDAAEERFGGLDILVNNAALTVNRTIWEIEPDEWDRVLAVNLRGVLFGCQVAGPRLRDRGWGRIVNMASIAGQQGGAVGGAHYAASKGGILVLTKIVARELAGSGVTVNALAPAAIRGPVMDTMPQECLAQLEATIPVGRFGTIDEVAELTAFLCTEEAGYITGATLDINGGLFMR